MQVTNNITDDVCIVGSAQKIESFTLANSKEFFDILSKNLYSNPVLAMVRETMCNAWDAHIKANIPDKPIKAYVEDNKFIVQDFGIGIPHEKIQNIYGIFGGSTKADDITQTGGFGLGCKAPFAVTDNFLVEDIYDGKKVIYSCLRSDPDNNGLPSIRTIISVDTSEHNGIKVTVPISPYTVDKVKDCIDYIRVTGDILINDITANHEYISGDKWDVLVAPFWYTRYMNCSGFNIKYGNVVYPIDNSKLAELGYTKDDHLPLPVVFHAEPNTLTIAPSRETLIYNEQTKETIKEFIKYFDKSINEKAIELVKKLHKKHPDNKDVLKFIIELLSVQNGSSFLISGIDNKLEKEGILSKQDRFIIHYVFTSNEPKLPLNLVDKDLPSSIYKCFKILIKEKRTDKFKYFFRKIFDKYADRLYLYEESNKPLKYSSVLEPVRIPKNYRYNMTHYIYNTVIITNSVSKLRPDYGAYLISLPVYKSEEAKEYFTSLGFNVEIANIKATRKSNNSKGKNEGALRIVYDDGNFTARNIKLEDIKCYANSYCSPVETVLGNLSSRFFDSSDQRHYINKFFENNVCAFKCSYRTIESLKKKGILEIHEYMDKLYKENMTEAKEKYFNKIYKDLLKTFPLFGLFIQPVFNYRGDRDYLDTASKAYFILNKNKNYKKISIIDWLGQYLELENISNTDFVLFYRWFDDKIEQLIKNPYTKDFKKFICRIYKSKIDIYFLHSIANVLNYSSCNLSQEQKEQILHTILRRKQ